MLGSCLVYSSIMKMSATCCSEMLVDFHEKQNSSQPPLSEHGELQPDTECDFTLNVRDLQGYMERLMRSTRSQDSAVGSIATDYGLDDRGVEILVPVRSRIFSMSSRPPLGPTQPIQWVPEALSRGGVKRPGREADHSPPASSEAKKMWIYTSTSPYVFMA
jgi:hypothetical protein